MTSTGITYTPLDIKLEWPRVRILRAIRHFEWVTSFELFEVCAPELTDEYERNSYAKMLGRLVVGGFIERRAERIRRSRCHVAERQRVSMGNTQFEYRITARGRAELARLLATDTRMEWAPPRESEAECA
jgi:hypothetical protein